MAEEKKKGIFIDDDIATRFDLTWNEKIVYITIKYLNGGVSMLPISNAYLSKRLGIEERTIRSVLKSLYEKRLIMFQRKSPHSAQRFVLLYNKATITQYKRYGLSKQMILDYKE